MFTPLLTITKSASLPFADSILWITFWLRAKWNSNFRFFEKSIYFPCFKIQNLTTEPAELVVLCGLLLCDAEHNAIHDCLERVKIRC